MKYLIALGFLLLGSSAQAADPHCDYGASNVFNFVKWEFKPADKWMEMTLTFHNTLKQTITASEIRIEVDGHGFGFRTKDLIKPDSDITVKSQFGMPKADAEKFQTLAPQLCVIAFDDDKGNHKSF